MFVAASTRCFAEMDLGDACQQIVELGYDKVELAFDEDSRQLNAAEIASDPDAFFSYFRELTRLTPVAISLTYDPSAEILGGLAKLAKLMQVTNITVPASPLGTPFNTEVDRLREFLTLTSHESVRLSLKTQSGHLTEDLQTAVELCRAVDGLGLTLDPSYYLDYGESRSALEPTMPYVLHVHLRDSTPEQLQVPTGLGNVDYSRLINQLRQKNYQRALSVDLIPSLTEKSGRSLEMRKLRMLLETLL